jgi:hypothetical protein
VNPAPALAPPSAPRLRMAKKRPARRISTDVTIDPFK